MELQVALPVSTLAKYKTAIQMVAIGFLLVDESGRLVIYYAPEIGLGLLWLAAGLTLITGYDYVRQGMKHAKWSDDHDRACCPSPFPKCKIFARRLMRSTSVLSRFWRTAKTDCRRRQGEAEPRHGAR